MKHQSAVYVGEIGDIVVAAPLVPIDEDLDTDALTNEEMFNLLLNHGVDVRLILGIDHCYEHYNMKYLGGMEMPEGYKLLQHCSYCRNCWTWYRIKQK